MYFRKILFLIPTLIFSNSCITQSEMTPELKRTMERRRKLNTCLNVITSSTNGSAEKITQNTMIYLNATGKEDILITPYDVYKLSRSEKKYCLRLPTNHSIWKIDKTAGNDRITNDDTCGSFVSLDKIRVDGSRYEKLIRNDIDNRLLQLDSITKATSAGKSDEELKKIREKETEIKKVCSKDQGE